jgi:hypothetical protein
MLGTITVKMSGAAEVIASGRAEGMIDDSIPTALEVVGGHAVSIVHRVLDEHIVDPTPYYETQIRMDLVSQDEAVVHDSGVVYGPWLEGTSYRNMTTRFKGYFAFRTTLGEMDGQIPALLDDWERQIVARINRG